MITLYGFGRIFAEGHGETKDLWAQWGLEEVGLPYRVHALDHTGGELDGDVQPNQPRRSGAADRRRLRRGRVGGNRALPRREGRHAGLDARRPVVLGAVGTVRTPLVCKGLIGMFDSGQAAPQLHADVRKIARCLARPAWQRTLALYAERIGVSVDAIR
jgi:glutathione S-transferase